MRATDGRSIAWSPVSPRLVGDATRVAEAFAGLAGQDQVAMTPEVTYSTAPVAWP